MLSKSLAKYINSLHEKKLRNEQQRFVAEGTKVAVEFLKSGMKIHQLLADGEWLKENEQLLSEKNIELTEVSDWEMKKVSSLQTPSRVLMVVQIPEHNIDYAALKNSFIIMLDGIRDPGNLGTIIRIADWFGIECMVCSHDTVSAYNGKVVQSAMGSLARVKVVEESLSVLFFSFKGMPVYGLTLDGKNIDDIKSPQPGIILIGNEGKGISEEIFPFVTHPVTIPRIGKAESLNAAVAAGIACYCFCGRK